MVKHERRTVTLLLLEDFEALGEVGDIVAVKPGYARNYLMPSGIGTLPTADALSRVERAKKAAAAGRAQRVAELASLAKELADKSINLEERASEEGHLFGSVDSAPGNRTNSSNAHDVNSQPFDNLIHSTSHPSPGPRSWPAAASQCPRYSAHCFP